jgi:hypothetical protein
MARPSRQPWDKTGPALAKRSGLSTVSATAGVTDEPKLFGRRATSGTSATSPP